MRTSPHGFVRIKHPQGERSLPLTTQEPAALFQGCSPLLGGPSCLPAAFPGSTTLACPLKTTSGARPSDKRLPRSRHGASFIQASTPRCSQGGPTSTATPTWEQLCCGQGDGCGHSAWRFLFNSRSDYMALMWHLPLSSHFLENFKSKTIILTLKTNLGRK